MSYEERVTPFEAVPEAALVRVTPYTRQRGSGHLAVLEHARTPSRDNVCSLSMDEPMGKPAAEGAYVSQHLTLASAGKALGGKPRSEPDSGNPTVRDRRGALGNVTMGAGLRPSAKALDKPPDPTVRAPKFYPDHCRAVLDGESSG